MPRPSRRRRSRCFRPGGWRFGFIIGVIPDNAAIGFGPARFENDPAIGVGDLQDFVSCYSPKNRFERAETERFRAFTYDEIIQGDKVSLDIFWIRDTGTEDPRNLPAPDVIADDIIENLGAALEQFAGIRESLVSARHQC